MTNNTASTNRARKPRRKQWASEVARKQHAKQRRDLSRAASIREEERMATARADLRRAEGRQAVQERTRRNNLVAGGLTPRLTAVMSSWGLTLPVSIQPAITVGAWTDFRSITVRHDSRLINDMYGQDAEQSVLSDADLREIAIETRALFYHEVGHCLFSTPLPTLVRLAWNDGFDFPEQHVTVATVVDPTIPRAEEGTVRFDFSASFHHAWNILEDQRMECALVEESPQIAAYLTVLVLRKIAGVHGSWPLVAGRRYLSPALREQERERYLGDAEEIDLIISAYRRAQDPVTMLQCVLDLIPLIEGRSFPEIDQHKQGTQQTNGQEPNDARERLVSVGRQNTEADKKQEQEQERTPAAGDQADSKSGDEPGAGGGSQGEQGDEPGQPGGDEQGDEPSGAAGNEPGAGGNGEQGDEPIGNGVGTGSGEPTERKGQDADDLLQQTLNDLAQSDTVQEDVVAMNEAYNSDQGSLSLYDGIAPLTDQALVAQAHGIVDDIVRAFDAATADCAPHWESGQRRGVLEPIRYRTRQPGDWEVFRQYVEDGEPGVDLAVSLFLDVSGSMDGAQDVLGATAWAVKTACQRIGVECDVTVFDHSAYRVWSTDDAADEVISLKVAGGTDPEEAFLAVLGDERSKKHHLVLIMTDGQWSHPQVIKNYKHSNTLSAVFYYSPIGHYSLGSVEGVVPDPAMALNLLVDEAYRVSDLLEIPEALEKMLLSLV